MNSITLIGHVVKDAEVVLINNSGIETPLVTFSFIDTGLPYQKSDPMFIEIHFLEEAAMHIFKYLKRGKEVTITGFLRSKTYVTKLGETKQKYYIQAKYIILNGQPPRKED